MRRPGPIALAAAATGAAVAVAARPAADRIVARTERRLNRVGQAPPYEVSPAARALHETLLIADLHADSLLWGRDLLRRGDRGHVDVPRLIEGNVALQAFAACVKVPRRLNVERNEDRSDDVTLLALGQRWPPATWRSHLARAIHLADRLRRFVAASEGRLTLIESSRDLAVHLERRADDRAMTAGVLTIEGAAALDDDPANVDVLADAGFRLLGLSHFVDNAFAGSAHGVEKGGLTPSGRDLVRRAEARSVIVDLAHASVATVDDVLAMAERPVVVSHTGVQGTCPSIRNLSDEHLRAVAATGGIVGIGYFPTVCCGDDAPSIARAIEYAIDVAGVDHVGLGSDFDGGVPVPFDASGLPLLTEALLAHGLGDDEIRKVMGGNVLRLLAGTLPTH